MMKLILTSVVCTIFGFLIGTHVTINSLDIKVLNKPKILEDLNEADLLFYVKRQIGLYTPNKQFENYIYLGLDSNLTDSTIKLRFKADVDDIQIRYLFYDIRLSNSEYDEYELITTDYAYNVISPKLKKKSPRLIITE